MKKSKLKAQLSAWKGLARTQSQDKRSLDEKRREALGQVSYHREAHHAAQKGIRRLHTKVAGYERFLRDNQIWQDYQQQQAIEAGVARAKQKAAWLAEHPEDRPAAP